MNVHLSQIRKTEVLMKAWFIQRLEIGRLMSFRFKWKIMLDL